MHTPGGSKVTLMLEDISVESPEAAQKLAAYLAAGFNLNYDSWAGDAL
jgi:hypothetical protein